MNNELEKIQEKIVKLKKDAKDLQQLKSACEDLKKFRKSLIETKFD